MKNLTPAQVYWATVALNAVGIVGGLYAALAIATASTAFIGGLMAGYCANDLGRTMRQARNRTTAPPTAAKDEAGVSPVIGVILMVAITVVLAVVVFVLVSNLGDVAEAPPSVAIADDGQGNYTVVKADRGLAWSDFTTDSADCTLPTGHVGAGDRVTGCTVPLVLVHDPTNSIVYRDD